jgi:hypothetical protein
VEHQITIHEVGEGGVQAVCSCGWRSPAFGTDKTPERWTHCSARLMPAICTNGRCPCDNRPRAQFLGIQNGQIRAASVLIGLQPTPSHIGGYVRSRRGPVPITQCDPSPDLYSDISSDIRVIISAYRTENISDDHPYI